MQMLTIRLQWPMRYTISCRVDSFQHLWAHPCADGQDRSIALPLCKLSFPYPPEVSRTGTSEGYPSVTTRFPLPDLVRRAILR